jgi:hypothetical protein
MYMPATRKTPKPTVANKKVPYSGIRGYKPKSKSIVQPNTIRSHNIKVSIKNGPTSVPPRPVVASNPQPIKVTPNRTMNITIPDTIPYTPVLILHDGTVDPEFINKLRDTSIRSIAIATMGPNHIDGVELSIVSKFTTIRAIHYMLSNAMLGFLIVVKQDKSIISNGWDRVEGKPYSYNDGILFLRRNLLCDNLHEFTKRLEGLDI